MITPGLWRRALRQGANARLLLIWLVGLAIPALRLQPGIDWNEGGGEHTLAQEVLQKIRDAKREAEGIGGVGEAEEV